MKVLINNNWIELSVFTGIMFGIAEAGGEVLIMVGPFALIIKTRMFKKRNRRKHPNEL
jgi:hypothetical protein